MLSLNILVALTSYSAACLGLGELVLHFLVVRQTFNNRPSAGAQLATALLLGQGILSNLWLLLALAGWFSPLVVVGIVLVLTFICVVLSKRLIIEFANQIRSIWHDLWSDTWAWQIISMLTLGLCLVWPTSIGRPLSMDGGAFYMALPKLVAGTHILKPLPGIYEDFTSIGLQAEMHYAALISLGSPDAARLFDWPTILAGTVLLLALGRQVGLERHGQWITLAMLFTSTAVIWLSGFGKTDLFATAFGLAAFYWAVKLKDGQHRLPLWLVGLFCGFAIVAKFTYIPSMVPGITLIIGWVYLDAFLCLDFRKHNPTIIIMGMLQILTGFLVASLPHLIKNSVLFHNPFAPFGAGMPEYLTQAWLSPDTTRHILHTYPLALTFGNYYSQLGNLSPLVLAFFPLMLFLPRPKFILDSPLFVITIAALAGLLAWILVRPSFLAPRYFLACMLLFTLPAARGAEYVSQNERKPRWLTAGVLTCISISLITIGFTFQNLAFFPLKTYQYVTGHLPKCGRELQYCEPMVIINDRVPPGTRLFTNSYQRFWLRIDLIQCLITAEEIESYLTLQLDEARWNFIYRRGFQYLILFDHPGFLFQNIPVPDLEHVPDWLSVTREEIGHDAILKIESRDSDHEVAIVCRPQNIYEWRLVSPFFSSR